MGEIKLGYYKHFKGEYYKVIGMAKHSETLEDMVIYCHVNDMQHTWVRPASMWNEIVKDKDGNEVRRFEYIGSMIKTMPNRCGECEYLMNDNYDSLKGITYGCELKYHNRQNYMIESKLTLDKDCPLKKENKENESNSECES